jgi:secreted trypsin-like serine protease
MSRANRITLLLALLVLCFAACYRSDEAEPFIYGGTVANEGQFPFMVSLYDVSEDTNICGGSLISPLHVLTASHCTQGWNLAHAYVGAGAINIHDSDNEFIWVNAIDDHPSYNDFSLKNDITVLFLEKPFSQTTNVRTIAIGTNKPATGAKLTVAGWGEMNGGSYPSTLRYVSVPVISISKCKSYNGYGGVEDVKQICAFVKGKDSCYGDSGGPLFTGSGASAKQYGVVSWGEGCAVKPGVYTRVNYYDDWIKTVTGYQVCFTCNGCTVSGVFKGMCTQMDGRVTQTSSEVCCKDLNAFNIRQINKSWSGCASSMAKTLCNYVGKYTCTSSTSKCSSR